MNVNIEKNRMDLAYVIMMVTNFFNLIYVNFIISITIYFVSQTNQSISLLKSIDNIPLNSQYRFLLSILGFIVLVFEMKLLNKYIEDLNKFLIIVTLEILTILFIIQNSNFVSNNIIIFVLADLIAKVNSTKKKNYVFIVMIIFYILSSYEVMSNFFTITPMSAFYNFYTNNAKGVFQLIQNIFTSINFIAFTMYLIYMLKLSISESKRINQLNLELQDLNVQLKEYANIREVMGETKERNRLAREIHDTLGHTLTGLSTGLDACYAVFESNQEFVKKQLLKLSKLSKEGLNDVRRSVNKLRPDALERLSLKDAIANMISEFNNVSKTKIIFACHFELDVFRQDEEEIIYRIVQEGITNAVRHGKATKVYVSFALSNGNLIIIIEDNGIGCTTVNPGFGLHHMQERIQLLNGKLRFVNNDGFSLIVEIQIRGKDYGKDTDS